MSRKLLFAIELILRVSFAGGIVLLWSLPASYFDEGPVVCYWKRTYGVECPGCGLTRGTQYFIHGHWSTAVAYNPLSAVVGGGLMLLWGLNLWGLYQLWVHRNAPETPTVRTIRRLLDRLGLNHS